MDELLREFLTETNESLDTVDVELVRFEQEPDNAQILANVFRLVHTIKGTCGFIGLPRLEALAHAAETLMGKFRDGMPVTGDAVTLILTTVDRIKHILAVLEASEREPDGGDLDLIGALDHMASGEAAASARAQETTGSSIYQAPRSGEPDALPRTPFAAAAPVFEPRHSLAAEDEDQKGESRVSAQSIRVQVDTLEHLMTMVSELVLTRNQLLEIARGHAESAFKAPLQRLSNVTAELQEGMMKTRMQPVGNAWQKLPRLVRDLAAELGKDIDLQMFGAETELDRQVLDLIKDPLTHMVRNAADHGLETVAERRAAGKPETGTIRLSARPEGGYIVIEIADDGRGLDAGRIKAKALAAGLVSEAEAAKLPDTQVYKFVFAPGLSTARKITSISGRGVGMDVVKTNIDKIGGTIDVRSAPAAGAAFTLRIPLTLTIVAALIVEADGERFAIPQLAVIELVRAQANAGHRVERIEGAPVLRLRDRLVPLVRLAALLGHETPVADAGDGGLIVVMQVGSQKFGVVVDGVFHTEEIVVKPVSSRLRHIGLFSGATILGDGSVIMILDPNGIGEVVGLVSDGAQAVSSGKAEEKAAAQTTSLLVFRAGSQELKAVPLSLVTRLEEIDAGTIEISNGRQMVQYRGRLMPLVGIDGGCRVRAQGKQPILVFSDGSRAMGLAVDEIVDIAEERLTVEVASDTPGVIGSAVIRGRATEVVDVGHFLPLACKDWFRGREARGGGRTPTLLFVDDSPFFRSLLPPVLQAAGYEVVTVGGGEEALGALGRGAAFEAIVADIEMPGMDGFALAAAVRGDERTARIPLIALSAHAAPGTVERVRAAGFRDFVAKFDRPGLVAALKAVSASWGEAA